MTDSDDRPLSVLLSCRHSSPLQDPESFNPYRVVPNEGGWGVRSEGTWCPACAAAGRAPNRTSRWEAWDEVERRRATDIRA